METISMSLQTLIAIIGYAVGITAWLIRLQMTVNTKASAESTNRAHSRIDQIEKSLDGDGGLKKQVEKALTLLNEVNLNLQRLLDKNSIERV